MALTSRHGPRSGVVCNLWALRRGEALWPNRGHVRSSLVLQWGFAHMRASYLESEIMTNDSSRVTAQRAGHEGTSDVSFDGRTSGEHLASESSEDSGPVTTSESMGTLRKSLKNRHIQLIALGGAIGTGLFYGSSDSISLAGPSILLAYLIGGLAIFMIVRALS